MRRGRPPKPDTKYHIIVHATNGVRYAATKAYKESKSGKMNHCYVHWGRLLEGDRFQPGMKYIHADPEERKKLKFPEGWDLSEIESLERAAGTRRRAPVEAGDAGRRHGVLWLLGKIAANSRSNPTGGV